jgi:transposase-like protein
MIDRGLRAPALVIADGAPGIWKAVRELWPVALEQRCTIHALRNVTSKLPERHHSEVKTRWWKLFDEARSAGEARQQLQALIGDYRAAYPSAMAVIERDLDALVTHLRFPSEHRKRIRTSRRGDHLLTRARSPSFKNGLPNLRCSRMPLSQMVAPYSPTQTRSAHRGGRGSQEASALFHTGYEPAGENVRRGPSAHQGDRPLSGRDLGAVAHLGGIGALLPWLARRQDEPRCRDRAATPRAA